MAVSGWFYPVAGFDTDGIRLCDDGSVVLADRRYRNGEAIDLRVSGHHAVRSAGAEEPLVIRRTTGDVWCFVFRDGGWQRFAPSYRVNPWKYALHDIILKRGLATPFLGLAVLVGLGGGVGAIYTLFSDWRRAVWGAVITVVVIGALLEGNSRQKT